ncbi:hypothetical protein HIM_10919 [Hirsutella minnesotensis 3608]|uniref:CCHC-type domain-containing protein n=1 Tax=Hirsutella minnesotensis 3608 TaxID=1043627 RepID=A0A0F7ZRJ0_9HYPO|nr:hypothetical protein HIM_10919 [Hirsutella minnesotensis 3608]
MATVEKVWELLDEYRAEFQGLKETLKEQNEIIRDQQEIIRKQKEDAEKQGTINQELSLHLKDIKQQMNDQLKQVQKQLEAIVAGAVVTPPSTFAEVARSTPSPQQSTVRSLSSNSTAESTANELFCMIDTSRVEEQDRGRATVAREFGVPSGRLRYRLQGRPPKAGQEAKNTRLSRPEEKALCRYIDRLDHINLAVRAEFVTDAANHILCERSGQTDSPLLKAYGSMVVYLTKKNDAKKLLDGKYFDLAGESACTNPFEPRKGPMQCFNCQEMGHKAFRCKKPQVCGRCASAGHHHRECQAMEPKCVLCGGPHEAFSRNCRVRHTHINA